MFFRKEKETALVTQKYYVDADGHRLYGELVKPKQSRRKLPLVICSHGFNGSLDFFKGLFAETMGKQGYAVYYYDFYAGSKRSRSGGSLLEQSPLDEAKQLADVLEHFRAQDFVDPSRIYLFGESQGGFVSAYEAAGTPEKVRGLILFYPALCILDDIQKKYASFEQVPQRVPLFGLTLSNHYYEGMYDFDIYARLPAYRGPVLLVHGDQDSVVPVSYGRRAAACYERCEYREFKGQNHGFNAQCKAQALEYVLEFLKNN